MKTITEEQIQSIRRFAFRNGRLLERQLFVHVFEHDNESACLDALKAYQNKDGGFGNGIEPDILCPESSAIGAETALLFLDQIDSSSSIILKPLVEWLETNQLENGEIPHPPKSMARYPYEPWWKNPDGPRVLTIAGLLAKMGIDTKSFHYRVRSYYESLSKKTDLAFYDYPYFVYLKYCGITSEDADSLSLYTEEASKLCETSADHFPLFCNWFEAADQVSESLLKDQSAILFERGLQADGGLKTAYEHLPWWRPIWTMTCMSSLKRLSLL